MGDWKNRLRYFRCCSIIAGQHTCPRKKCESPGKAPWARGWQQEALAVTPEQVEVWCADPKINLGILCGPESDLLVLDVDKKDDANGFETLRTLQKQHGQLPATYWVLTGSGGRHYYFKHPTTHPIRNAVKFAPGLDVRTTGGLVIAPGGRHISGNTYQVSSEYEPAEAPSWLLDAIVKGQGGRKKSANDSPKKSPSSRLPDRIPDGQRDVTLYKHACYLRGQKGMSEEQIVEELLRINRERCDPPKEESEVRAKARQACEHPAALPFDDSDQALVAGFAAERHEVLRYADDDQSWWACENGVWQERRKGPIFETGEFLKTQEPSDTSRTLHRRLNSSQAVKSILHLSIGRPEFRLEMRDFDPDPWIVGLPDGLALDMRTGEVRGARPSDLLTRVLPVAPCDEEPEKSCPRWLEYLEQAHPEDSDLQGYLQRYGGYCLTDSTREEMVLFFIGRQGAGKGVFVETTQAVLGPSYFTMIPLDMLLEEAKEDRRLNHIAELRGKRLGVCNEGARSKKLDRNALKSLSGGGSVSGRRLGHQKFDFPMTTKILVVANDEPVLDLDEATRVRVHVVPFNVMFRNVEGKEDKGLKEYLRQKELPGITRWFVDGCMHWQRDGLKPPATVIARTAEYFVNADTLDKFLIECCEWGSEFFEETTLLFKAAKKFCKDAGEEGTVTHARLLIPELQKRLEPHKIVLKPERHRGKDSKGGSGYRGIRLKEEFRTPAYLSSF